MIKLTILLRRKPELSQEQFVAYHRDQHAPLVRSLPIVRARVRRIVQQHAVAVEGLPPASFDGMTELWFDTLEDMAAVFSDPTYLERLRPDEERFCDVAASELLVSTEHAVLPAPPADVAGDVAAT